MPLPLGASTHSIMLLCLLAGGLAEVDVVSAHLLQGTSTGRSLKLMAPWRAGKVPNLSSGSMTGCMCRRHDLTCTACHDIVDHSPGHTAVVACSTCIDRQTQEQNALFWLPAVYLPKGMCLASLAVLQNVNTK